VSTRRLDARSARWVAGIGRRSPQRADDKIAVIDRVRCGERHAPARPEGAGPRVPHTRFQLAFGELAGEDEPFAVAEREVA
jgi:hypothetical protein